jgi:Domain of unknown function (DUF4878)
MTYTAPHYPMQPPPARKSNTTKIVLIVVGAVLTLCCAGAAVGGYAIYRTATTTLGPVHDTAETFLKDLESGSYDNAYNALCASTREAFSRERFGEIVTNRPRPSRHEITNTFVSSGNGPTRGHVTAQLRYADGSSDTHTFQLVREESGWKICGQPY